MEQRNSLPRVVLAGKTGSGKSALGNKILDQEAFKVGFDLQSETETCQEQEFRCKKTNQPLFTVMDVVGFAENRTHSLNNYLEQSFKLMKSLENGFSVLLFCVPITKSRFDATDIDDLRKLSCLFGKEFFSHFYIVLTQLNRIEDAQNREKAVSKWSKLPELLVEKGVPIPLEGHIMFSDFDNFEPFSEFLQDLVNRSEVFQPQTHELDLSDPIQALKNPILREFMDLLQKESEVDLEVLEDMIHEKEEGELLKARILLIEILKGDKGEDAEALTAFLEQSTFTLFKEIGEYFRSQEIKKEKTLINDIYKELCSAFKWFKKDHEILENLQKRIETSLNSFMGKHFEKLVCSDKIPEDWIRLEASVQEVPSLCGIMIGNGTLFVLSGMLIFAVACPILCVISAIPTLITVKSVSFWKNKVEKATEDLYQLIITSDKFKDTLMKLLLSYFEKTCLSID